MDVRCPRKLAARTGHRQDCDTTARCNQAASVLVHPLFTRDISFAEAVLGAEAPERCPETIEAVRLETDGGRMDASMGKAPVKPANVR
jgi:hypothetical protein